MKIPLLLIKDTLQSYNSVLSPCSINDNLLNIGNTEDLKGWYQMIQYTHADNPSTEFIYFGTKNDFSENLCDYGIICIGKPSANLLEHNDILYFSDDTDYWKLYMDIQNIFLKFGKWDDSLHHALRNNQPFNVLFRIAKVVFENSMFMHDSDFFELACIDRMPEEAVWEYNSVMDKYYLPEDILNDFKVNPDYLATMSTESPCIFPDTTFGYTILYQNLWDEGQYRGRICVNELCRKLRPSDAYLLNYFSEIVMEAFKLLELSSFKPSFSLSRFLIKLIEEKTIDRMTMDTILMQYGWAFKDDYFCVCLFPEERDTHTHSVQYQCNRLEDKFPHSCVFSYKECIVMLLNITLSETTIPMFQNHIAVILRESLMKAGISSVCSDLNQFRYYYWQAVSAFETGRRKQETFWSYCFVDYQTIYVLRTALQQLPAELLCNKGILELEEYDKTHTSNLSLTLRIYMENERNIAKTSLILDIHRSTLLYRIERIEDITKLNLDNPDVRFNLLLSYQLLEESRGHI